MELQPYSLADKLVALTPLAESDFEKLFSVASDPLIWEQHPNKNRYQRTIFENFFKGAMESGGAFLVSDNKTQASIGSSRFYEYNEKDKSIAIGYTFLARSCWGKGYNNSMKTIMLNHAFVFVNTVVFHVGAENVRSQKAMNKLNAIKVGEVNMEYYGEPNRLNFIYHINKIDWAAR